MHINKSVKEICKCKACLIIDSQGQKLTYTDKYAEATQCPICLATRFNENKIAQKSAAYYPIIPRLKFQYADSEKSKLFRYRSNYVFNNNTYCDIFDGDLYKRLLYNGIIKDERDLILSASLDGYQIFRQHRDDNWVIILINNNIPPEDRVKQENLLIVAIIPGPNSPKNFNSFIRPIINELKKLEDGIVCWDGWKKEKFILRAFPIWCGDIPAISKLTYITGHNGYMCCRFCDLKEVLDSKSGVSHVYYPLKHPTNNGEKSYNIENLPLRNHKSYLNKVSIWKATLDKKKKHKEKPVSIQFPASFPLDIMHLIFEGAAMQMYKHWSGIFYSDKSLNNTENNPQTLSKIIWKNIGNILEINKKSMPSEFGRSPPNITQYSNLFKAEDWVNRTFLYSLPLPQHFHENWYLFVEAARIAYPIERLCGILQPMVRSNLNSYKNLMNNILLQDRFYHLRFVSDLYGGEELWVPSLDYTLNNKEFKALSNFYHANLDEPILEIIKYAKLRTREGYMIGSLMSKVAANARDNSCIMGKYQLFAYIHNVKNVRKGLCDLYSYEEFGDYEFVDVSRIQKCIGFLRVGKCFYVIDKTN
ncbi:4690_t:CDS:2 [Gigaspora margarita]|uniref:4690_t:CDS:1 n=1 Tax=Gigaspora margarita TaxID=4874 RepID=A0ABN7UIL6_GIGMA|nr:4690_t:CDS:2 [Gigaspora margarita]